MERIRVQSRHLYAGVVLLSLVALLGSGGGLSSSVARAGAAARPVHGGTLTIAYVPFGTHIDVNSGNLSTLNEVAHYFYETLFDRDPKAKLAPLLVKEQQVSGDGLTVIWKLQPGVKFHDGTPFNAAAVKWNLDRKRAKKQPVHDHVSIQKVDVVDNLTVRVTLARPQASLAAFLSTKTFSMYSPTFAQKVGDDALKQQASGTGPFMVAEFRPNEILRLKKNPNYWQRGLPYLDEIVLRTVPDANARATMLQAGDADVALGLTAPDIVKFKSIAGFKVLQETGSLQYYITMNNRRAPLDDVRVRRAINHAVDKDGIIKAVLLGLAKPATAPYVAPTVDGHVSAGVYEYDPERAKKLLDEAGWKSGPDGIRQKDGKPLRLELITRKGAVTGDFEMAELVQAMLKAVGIDVKLTVQETATFISRVTKPPEQADYDMVSLSINIFVGDVESIMDSFFNCRTSFPPQYYNRAYFCNKQVDAWIDESKKAVTLAERDKIYARILKQVFEDAPIIQLFDVQMTAVVKDTVHGVYLAGSQNNWPAKYAWKEKR